MSQIATSSPALWQAQDRESATKTAAPASSRWGFLEFFIIAQVVLPALLYLPGTQSIRIVIRIAPFALSLAALGWDMLNHRERKYHPAFYVLLLAILYVAAMIFSPSTNTFLAGFGQTMLYLSVLAPVIWVTRYVRDVEQVNRILAILLVCNGINACVGILQVVNPQTWLPKEFSSVVMSQSSGALTYMGPDGREIVRPPGLSDNPGAVCGPATTAALLGLINCVRPMKMRWKLFGLLFAFAGIAAVFLSHVRTNILILAGMILVYMIALVVQKEIPKAVALAAIGVAMVAGSFFFAAILGGGETIDRFASLLEDDPTSVYYSSARGYQLQYDTTAYLSAYPMGAGLGRWGMMRTYFGDDNNLASTPIWAELQYPAWALDGGIVLLVLYNVAVLISFIQEAKLTVSKNRRLRDVAAVIFAANCGTIALIFGYTPFTTQVGLQYWFLGGLLFGLMLALKRKGEVV